MATYRVTLAYDGTDFLGWQAQSGKTRTVQGVFEEALARLGGGGRVPVVAASRTDTGVHALGQVAAFDLGRDMSNDDLTRALNGLLPEDLRVVACAAARAGFHPRKSAASKLYRYVMDTGPVQIPQRRRYAGHVPWTLDESLVKAAAAAYSGRRDFASLASSGGSAKTTVRTVTRSEAVFDGATLVYEVEADGFLRKMVRSLVGGLVAAGRGAWEIDHLRRALEQADRRAWPPPAPACGLTLVRVDYPAAMLE